MKFEINHRAYELLLTAEQCIAFFKLQTVQDLVVYLQSIYNATEEIKTLSIDDQEIDVSVEGLPLPLKSVQTLLPLLTIRELQRLPVELVSQVLSYTDAITVHALLSLPSRLKPPAMNNYFGSELGKQILAAQFQVDESLWQAFERFTQKEQATGKVSTFATWFQNSDLKTFLTLINIKNQTPPDMNSGFFLRWVTIFGPSIIAAYKDVAAATIEQKILYALVAPINLIEPRIFTEIFTAESSAVANYSSLLESLQLTQKVMQIKNNSAELDQIKATLRDRSFAYINFASMDFQYVNLRGTNLSSANLSSTNFIGTKLNGAYLLRVNLSGAVLKFANLSGANLSGANLSAANLFDANLNGAYLHHVNLNGAVLNFTKLSDTNLSGANLSGAILNFAKLSGTVLSDANLSGARLENVDLKNADLSKANLSGAILRDTYLIGANLGGAILRDANLNKVRLNNADLNNANLRGASLRGTNLSSTNLSSANLTDADLSDITWDKMEFLPNFEHATLAAVQMDFSIFNRLPISEKKTILIHGIQVKTLTFLRQQIAQVKTLEEIDVIMTNNQNGILYLTQTNQLDVTPTIGTFFSSNAEKLPDSAREFAAIIAARKAELEIHHHASSSALPTKQEEEGIGREEEIALEPAAISSSSKKRNAVDVLPEMAQSNKKAKTAEVAIESSDAVVDDATHSPSSSPSSLQLF